MEDIDAFLYYEVRAYALHYYIKDCGYMGFSILRLVLDIILYYWLIERNSVNYNIYLQYFTSNHYFKATAT